MCHSMNRKNSVALQGYLSRCGGCSLTIARITEAFSSSNSPNVLKPFKFRIESAAIVPAREK